MSLTYTLPFGSKSNLKNLVFSILAKEYPLRIVELANIIKKRYGRSVTFQAVRKAIVELTSDGVLEKKEKTYSIRREWIREAKEQLDALAATLSSKNKSKPTVDAVGGDISVFTFSSLSDLMRFWHDLVDDWFNHFTEGEPVNCWQGAHLWEGLLQLEREKQVLSQLKSKGIVSYALMTGSTPLDRAMLRFYTSLGIKAQIIPSHTYVDKTSYTATYGDLAVQVHYPDEIAKKLDEFFATHDTIDCLDLAALAEIVNTRCEAKMTVIRDAGMAQRLNRSIITQIGLS